MDAIPGNPVEFTIQATGTEPLNYNWEWSPAGEGGSEEWQPCSGAEGSDTTTLTIPSVQKSNQGSYRCVVSNCAGSQTSRPAKLEVSWASIHALKELIILKCHKKLLLQFKMEALLQLQLLLAFTTKVALANLFRVVY